MKLDSDILCTASYSYNDRKYFTSVFIKESDKFLVKSNRKVILNVSHPKYFLKIFFWKFERIQVECKLERIRMTRKEYDKKT